MGAGVGCWMTVAKESASLLPRVRKPRTIYSGFNDSLAALTPRISFQWLLSSGDCLKARCHSGLPGPGQVQPRQRRSPLLLSKPNISPKFLANPTSPQSPRRGVPSAGTAASDSSTSVNSGAL